jgi:transcriptional regulator with XRE-family HTH domain
MNNQKILHEIGSRIRLLRGQKNISQQDLAHLCDFQRASMCRIEAGKINISMLTLKKISDALEIPMREFFEDGVDNRKG